MTTGELNSTFLGIYTGAAAGSLVKIGYATSAQISFSANERDTTTKDDTDRFQKIKPGLRQCSLSTGGLVAWDATNNVNELYAAFDSGDMVVCRFTTDQTGDVYWEGEFFVMSIEINGDGTEENVTWTCSLKLGGSLTKGVEP